ncbi:MAG: GWxTD domain-containing protein, partial [Bacteroidetes bacterium]|nr:GWxTD domain-containing protein [Bacteroidota bacterium]
MRCVSTVLCTLSCIVLLSTPSTMHSQETDAESTHSLRGPQENPDARKELLRDVRENPTPDQLYALARSYVAEGSIRGRKLAVPLLRQAIAQRRDFIEARLLLASLYSRYARRSAQQEYQKIVAIAPNTAEAWLQLATMAEESFYDWRNSANRVLTPGTYVEEQSDMSISAANPTQLSYFNSMMAYRKRRESTYIPLMSSSHADYARAVHAYEEALRCDPSLLDAWQRLVLLHVEMEKYRDALGILDRAVDRFATDRDLHLLRAVCLTRLQLYADASRAFDEAFALMTAGERRDFRFDANVELLRWKYGDIIREASRAELEELFAHYWATTDPLYLSEENEALLEQYARIASANLRYGNALCGVRGWRTDRGKTLLRLGEPVGRLRLRPGIELGQLTLESKTEVWYYEDV